MGLIQVNGRVRRSAASGGAWLKVVLALLAIGVIVLVVGGLYVYRNPLKLNVQQTRTELAKAGFVRTEAGGLVTWQGGEGADLVFLHGAGHQAGAWSKVAPALADRYRIHLLDLPGHGESSPTAGPLKYSAVLAGVEAYLDTLEGRPILVGHSMGAWLATVYAHRHPDRVARLVLVNGGALRGDDSGVNLMPADREEARRTMAALRHESSPAIPDFVLDDIVRRATTGPIGRLFQELEDMEDHLLDGRLGEVSTPVDLIWGEADGHLDLDYARRLESQLPAARMAFLKRCGHLPPNECPEPFLERLEQVLASDPPAPAPGLETEPDPGATDDPS